MSTGSSPNQQGKYPDGYYQNGPLAGQPMPGHQGPETAPENPAPETGIDEGTPQPDTASEDAPTKKRFRRNKPGGKKRRREKQQETSSKASREMDVPPPGGRIRDNKRLTTAARVAGLGALALATLGACGLGGYSATLATRAVANADQVTAADLPKYHVTTFDKAAAAAYAGRYLDACLTRYAVSDTVEVDPREKRRQAIYQGMNAAGDDTSCDAADSKNARTVESVDFTGEIQDTTDFPGAKYVVMQVKTSDGTMARYGVPVWFQNPDGGGGPRVIGPIGALPPPRGGAPNPDKLPERVVDDELSTSLRTQFLPEFMKAWVASDRNLSQFLIPGATSTAAAGLNGAYKNPAITSVKVYPARASIQGSGAKKTFSYPDGATIQVDVIVDMTDPAGNPATGLGYRLTMVRSSESHWFVKDVRAGVISMLNGTPPAAAEPDSRPAPKPSPPPPPSPAPSTPAPSPTSSPASSAPPNSPTPTR